MPYKDPIKQKEYEQKRHAKRQSDPAYRERKRELARNRYHNDPAYREREKERWKRRSQSPSRKAYDQARFSGPDYKEYMRNHRKSKRDRVIEGYGGKCNCCGESEPRFLTIDHVNDDGSIDRKSRTEKQMIKHILEAGFPSDFQVLCYNCNMGRYRNGGDCPHNTPSSPNNLTERT